ncbi:MULTISPECIES: hypothetical protein [Hymenobacter]|uniref:Uncharacterized protein n=1 Tax=Hymenobacter mucosus TaxID=1411120 RepID=A0A239AJT2_9BACT|nr:MULTISPECIES: hypothetical protein [Hymenobacter]SNR95304.1 hypothetical protein SAMN06269173_1133 [Hymenobacter mucosus]
MSDESIPYIELPFSAQIIAAQHLRTLLVEDVPSTTTAEQVREAMAQLNMPVWALGDLYIYAPLDMLGVKSILCHE